jgi:hypothetical protein
MKLKAILGGVMRRAELRERNNDIEISITAPMLGDLYGAIALSLYARRHDF